MKDGSVNCGESMTKPTQPWIDWHHSTKEGQGALRNTQQLHAAFSDTQKPLTLTCCLCKVSVRHLHICGLPWKGGACVLRLLRGGWHRESISDLHQTLAVTRLVSRHVCFAGNLCLMCVELQLKEEKTTHLCTLSCTSLQALRQHEGAEGQVLGCCCLLGHGIVGGVAVFGELAACGRGKQKVCCVI